MMREAWKVRPSNKAMQQTKQLIAGVRPTVTRAR